jgi:DNA-binding response OmpR family regulator
MKNKKTILIVEDDLSIVTGLEDNLIAEGFKTITAINGLKGFEIAQKSSVDLVLLDIMLPGMNGFEICKKLRKVKPELPIVMLTARGTEMDKIAGLDYGADDYITKPFSLSELLARVRAVLRRTYPETEEIAQFRFDNIEIDFKAMKAFKGGQELKFTRKEYAILQYFIQHEGEVVHRHELLNQVWGYDKIPSTRTVDNFILDLRKKIEEIPSKPVHIVSISGVGYRFVSQ